MRDRYIPALITLIAGAITCIIDIYKKSGIIPSLIRLLVVLIIFYILGLIARLVILKTITYKPKGDDNEENNEGTENPEAGANENAAEENKDEANKQA